MHFTESNYIILKDGILKVLCRIFDTCSAFLLLRIPNNEAAIYL